MFSQNSLAPIIKEWIYSTPQAFDNLMISWMYLERGGSCVEID